jgi:prepilin-type N-terminal cleavage/methylation domain-containing protein
MKSRAFTLIELLVVIAIIAILAAILFPVFAQAKAAAKKAVDLSNMKQIGLAMFIYANDYDSGLPDCACINAQTEMYILAAKAAPYVKSNGIWKNPAMPYQDGSTQHGIVDYPISIGATVYMKAPDDPCVGVGKSKYPENGGYYYDSTGNASNYYNDIYPPMDYMFNPDMWSYQENGCGPGGVTGSPGWSHPGPNLDTGAIGGSTSSGTQQNGLNGIGPDGSMNLTSNAKAILFTDAPTDNSWQVGDSQTERSWWGLNYQGAFGTTVNCVFFDSHAKSQQTAAMEPNGQDLNDNIWECANCNNTQYVSPASNAGTMWVFWGTTFASPNNQ